MLNVCVNVKLVCVEDLAIYQECLSKFMYSCRHELPYLV